MQKDLPKWILGYTTSFRSNSQKADAPLRKRSTARDNEETSEKLNKAILLDTELIGGREVELRPYDRVPEDLSPKDSRSTYEEMTDLSNLGRINADAKLLDSRDDYYSVPTNRRRDDSNSSLFVDETSTDRAYSSRLSGIEAIPRYSQQKLLGETEPVRYKDVAFHGINVSNSRFFVPKVYTTIEITDTMNDLKFEVDPEMNRVLRKSLSDRANSNQDLSATQPACDYVLEAISKVDDISNFEQDRNTIFDSTVSIQLNVPTPVVITGNQQLPCDNKKDSKTASVKTTGSSTKIANGRGEKETSVAGKGISLVRSKAKTFESHRSKRLPVESAEIELRKAKSGRTGSQDLKCDAVKGGGARHAVSSNFSTSRLTKADSKESIRAKTRPKSVMDVQRRFEELSVRNGPSRRSNIRSGVNKVAPTKLTESTASQQRRETKRAKSTEKIDAIAKNETVGASQKPKVSFTGRTSSLREKFETITDVKSKAPQEAKNATTCDRKSPKTLKKKKKNMKSLWQLCGKQISNSFCIPFVPPHSPLRLEEDCPICFYVYHIKTLEGLIIIL